MKEMKIEWAYPHFVKESPEVHLNELDIKRVRDVPVVRLAEVDALLAEAVWAMEILAMDNPEGSFAWAKAKTVLASPVVKAWRERQKNNAQPDGSCAHRWETKRYWLKPYYPYEQCAVCKILREAGQKKERT